MCTVTTSQKFEDGWAGGKKNRTGPCTGDTTRAGALASRRGFNPELELLNGDGPERCDPPSLLEKTSSNSCETLLPTESSTTSYMTWFLDDTIAAVLAESPKAREAIHATC